MRLVCCVSEVSPKDRKLCVDCPFDMHGQSVRTKQSIGCVGGGRVWNEQTSVYLANPKKSISNCVHSRNTQDVVQDQLGCMER